jgi:hypothetical protein
MGRLIAMKPLKSQQIAQLMQEQRNFHIITKYNFFQTYHPLIFINFLLNIIFQHLIPEMIAIRRKSKSFLWDSITLEYRSAVRVCSIRQVARPGFQGYNGKG